jgi:hypothetical protein
MEWNKREKENDNRTSEVRMTAEQLPFLLEVEE